MLPLNSIRIGTVDVYGVTAIVSEKPGLTNTVVGRDFSNASLRPGPTARLRWSVANAFKTIFPPRLHRRGAAAPPIWLMRQAGRYLPSTAPPVPRRAAFDLCHSPSFCAEVLLQPLDRYDLDAAILFSDILTVPDAMGLGLSFGVGEGPGSPIRCAMRLQ